MDQSDPMATAVKEVNSVADALHELKERLHQYEQATARLHAVIDALEHVAVAASSIQAQFDKLLDKADAVTNQIEKARLTSEATAKAVPGVVARIEGRIDAIQSSLEAQNELLVAIKVKKGIFLWGGPAKPLDEPSGEAKPAGGNIRRRG